MDSLKSSIKEMIIKILQIPEVLKSWFFLRKVGEIGQDCKIMGPAKSIGGEYITIGDRFYGGSNCRIEAWERYKGQRFTPQIRIGNDVKINSACHIGAINRIEIGNDVLFGSHVFITDHSHGNSSEQEMEVPPDKRDLFSKGEVVIEDKCWVCENVIILPGVHIGYSSIIAAGAVVTKDVPAGTIVAGNPARVVKTLQ